VCVRERERERDVDKSTLLRSRPYWSCFVTEKNTLVI